MPVYTINRARNLRVFEKGMAEYPSDEEVVEACRVAGAGDLIGYDGKKVPLLQTGATKPWLPDPVLWVQKKGEQDKLLTQQPIAEGPTGMELLYVIKALAKLDLDWPGDIQSIRTLIHRARQYSAHFGHFDEEAVAGLEIPSSGVQSDK
jgi:hypothetical protein